MGSNSTLRVNIGFAGCGMRLKIEAGCGIRDLQRRDAG